LPQNEKKELFLLNEIVIFGPKANWKAEKEKKIDRKKYVLT